LPRQASPLRHESPKTQASTPNVASPAPIRKQASPALSKKSSPAVSRASPASAASAASAARSTPAPKKEKRIVLKILNKRSEFAAIVNRTADKLANTTGVVMPYTDDEAEDSPALVPAVQVKGATPVKTEMAPPPPPLSAIPAPNTEVGEKPPESPASDAVPSKPKLKLKLKFGGGGGAK
jgi:hypothetical protein